MPGLGGPTGYRIEYWSHSLGQTLSSVADQRSRICHDGIVRQGSGSCHSKPSRSLRGAKMFTSQRERWVPRDRWLRSLPKQNWMVDCSRYLRGSRDLEGSVVLEPLAATSVGSYSARVCEDGVRSSMRELRIQLALGPTKTSYRNNCVYPQKGSTPHHDI